MLVLSVIVHSLLASLATAQACLNTLNAIAEAEVDVTDSSIRRTYTLCPRTTYTTGILVDDTIVGGQKPINLRPNMSIRCGETGKRSNNCIITGATGVIGSPNNIGSNTGTIRLAGLTFKNLIDTGILVRGTGSIEITDCAFLDTFAVPNIYFETRADRLFRIDSTIPQKMDLHHKFEGDTRHEHERALQKAPFFNVTFTRCTFEGNTVGQEPGRNNTIIKLHSKNMRTAFNSCLFKNNDFGTSIVNPEFQALIYSAGALVLINNCFLNNKARGFAPVVALGTIPTAVDNYGTIDSRVNCPFIASFPGVLPGGKLINATCIDFDRTQCGFTPPPTSAPATSPPSPSNTCGGIYEVCTSDSECCSKRCRGRIATGVVRKCSAVSDWIQRLSGRRGGAAGSSRLPS